MRSSVCVAAVLAMACTAELGGTPPGSAGTANAAAAAPSTGGSSTGATGGSSVGGTGGGNGGTTTGGSSTGGSSTGGTAGTSGTSGTAGVVNDPNCEQAVKTTSQVPRLTNAQYDRTIRDLLGITNLTAANGVAPSTRLATDQVGGITELAWANYKDVADKIATQVMGDAAAKQNFLKCTPTAGDTTCLHNTIIEFGRRVFRRALTTEEIARFDAIVAAGAQITPTGTPDEIAQTVLYMFLISPSFLQRAEMVEMSDNAGHFTLSPQEVASRLAFMLWGSTPDTVLDQAADTGMLSTPDQIAAQAGRMLQDPKARDMVSAFHQYYLLMRSEGRWGTANRDPAVFPSFKAEMVPVITEETLKFFDKVAFTPNATFKDYLTSQTAFVNKDTAPLYGLSAAGLTADLSEVTLDATRPGFLTRLGFLMNFASYNRTSPIYRGAFITKEVLGIQLAAPPPGAAETPLPTGVDLDTNRKQVDAQTSGGTCAGCHHTYINPPGFVMETFDAMGQARTAEANGVALDTTGDVTIEDGKDPVHITNPAELMNAIASAPGAQRRYVEKWVSYAYQREADPADACTVTRLAAKMTAGNYTVVNLITDLTQTPAFRLRAVEGVQ